LAFSKRVLNKSQKLNAYTPFLSTQSFTAA